MLPEAFTPPAAQRLPDGASLGPVHLSVSDGERARQFWTHDVGLSEFPGSDDVIHLGAGDRELIVLHPGATDPVQPRHTGLYHVAIHLPDRKSLARVVARLLSLRYPNSPTDHAETEATYFSDPDGIGIELTFETPGRGELIIEDGKPIARLADGTSQSVTEALDVMSLLAELDTGTDLHEPMPANTRIGHLHLHVRDLRESVRFYEDVIGFGPHLVMDRIRMADFSLKTSFVPHALAINTWQGRGAPSQREGTAGLRFWTLHVPDPAAIDALRSRLDTAGNSWNEISNGIVLRDPSGNELHIISVDQT